MHGLIIKNQLILIFINILPINLIRILRTGYFNRPIYLPDRLSVLLKHVGCLFSCKLFLIFFVSQLTKLP